MNVFIGSGRVSNMRLARNGEILRFLLVVNEGDEKSRNEVPCMIFNPSPEIKGLLTKEPVIELQGRVRSYSFEIAGEKATRTEIIVNPKSLRDLDS